MATAKKTAAKKTAAPPPASSDMPARKSPATKPKPSTGTKASAAPSRNDALALLTKDHRDVKKLFKQYEKLVKTDAENSEKEALAGQICTMLTMHATIEEEIFYPAAREALTDEDLLDEAEVEHASAKDLIAQIEGSDAEDSLFDAKVHVLAEYIDHHVKEEEEEMFPKVRRTALDLVEIGKALKQRKEELAATGAEAPMPS